MKQFKYILLTLSVLLAASSCEDLTDVNIDPTRQADVDLNLLLPDLLSQTAYNQSANPARMPAIIMQHFTGFDAQQVQYSDYIIAEDAFNNFWNTGLYSGVLRAAQVIIDKAQEQDNTYYEGIAKIAMAEGYGMATMMFGDLPFSQALQGQENLKPAYDAQEQVINGVLAMLDEAIALLNNPSGVNPGGADLYYGGDAALWVKTAHGLKARYLAQSAKRNSGNWSAVLQEVGASFESIDEQPWFQFEDNQIANNPLAKFGIERPNTLIVDEGFAQKMTDRDDPRQNNYMEFAESQWTFYNGANPDLVWTQSDAATPLISYVELKFLEAEALYHTGAGAGQIQQALAEAIQASIDQVGITEDASAFVDKVSDLSGLSGEAVQERIIEEAYYAYFGYAWQQIWNNYRRTGYPDLTPNPNGANGLNPSGGIPQRFLYPVGEVQTNLENVQAAKDRQNGALLDVPLWVFE